MTNSAGNNASSVANLAVTRIALNSGGGWTANGGAVITNNRVALTDGLTGEARSFFLNYPQYIGAFRASFTYQDVGGGGADGAVFVIQNSSAGAEALGGAGGSLGYNLITPSVGLEFNVYSGNTNGYAFRTNGVTGLPYNRTGALRLDGGNPIGVALAYNGTTLSMTLTDAVAGVSFATNFPINIPATVGANAAYVGMTGGSGSVVSTQIVSGFSFISVIPLSMQVLAGGSITFSWPASAGGYVLQETTSLATGPWTTVTAPVGQINGMNQVTITPAGGAMFYRLSLP
jgi:hypothetical protein